LDTNLPRGHTPRRVAPGTEATREGVEDGQGAARAGSGALLLRRALRAAAAGDVPALGAGVAGVGGTAVGAARRRVPGRAGARAVRLPRRAARRRRLRGARPVEPDVPELGRADPRAAADQRPGATAGRDGYRPVAPPRPAGPPRRRPPAQGRLRAAGQAWLRNPVSSEKPGFLTACRVQSGVIRRADPDRDNPA